jgi:hypothetical protein
VKKLLKSKGLVYMLVVFLLKSVTVVYTLWFVFAVVELSVFLVDSYSVLLSL